MTPVFSIFVQPPIVIISATLLIVAILSLWMQKTKWLPLLFLSAYLIAGYFASGIHWVALPFIFLLGYFYYFALNHKLKKWIRIISGFAAFLLSLAFFLHLVPGFNNIKLISNVVLSTTSAPYTQYFNFDKPLVGFFILLFSGGLLTTCADWGMMLKKTLPLALLGFPIILILAFLLKFITYDPKWSNYLLIWALVNLFFTIVAEESLCRGFLQKYSDLYFTSWKYGAYVSLLLVSSFFGLLHIGGGWRYMFLATVAGLVYGRIYQITQRIEASILTHFGLNTMHFLLFSYPSLKGIVAS